MLRCIAWLPCVLVQFPRTVGCCPGEGCSQDYSGLVSAGCCATSGLRYAVVVLAGAFWLVFQNGALGSKEICNGLITMVVPKKGTRALLARPCRVDVRCKQLILCCRWLAFQQGPSVSCRRVLLLILGARASSAVAVFARAAVGVRRRPAHPCGCVAKAERAYMWCGLHRCRVVACGSRRRCPCLVGCSPMVGGVCCVGCVFGLMCLRAVVRCALLIRRLCSS
ncbi:hypothetical protein Taro_050907 [Colocasia esculenta]|uniref:Uncharacterized protein n=1 Tax=Colocasia esculenta TaxID=4460 RepID=A0A843XF24_COLES|nr:hypothetical protein [Colocasia esculenta]